MSHRRRPPDLIFLPDMVHILPGYPKQSSEDPKDTLIAIYLSFPVVLSQSTMVCKEILTNIVKSNMSSIGRSMRGSIVGTEPLNSSLREFPTNDNFWCVT